MSTTKWGLRYQVKTSASAARAKPLSSQGQALALGGWLDSGLDGWLVGRWSGGMGW